MIQSILVSESDVSTTNDAYKLGARLFIFTELLLFITLFVGYTVFRYLNPIAFELAAEDLNLSVDLFNTLIILSCYLVMVWATKAIGKSNKQATLILLLSAIFLAFMFIVNQYFTWKGNVDRGMFPGSLELWQLGQGDVLFYSLYYLLTGVHVLHVLIGFALMILVTYQVNNNSVSAKNSSFIRYSGLYWRLIVVTWIIIFVLFYFLT